MNTLKDQEQQKVVQLYFKRGALKSCGVLSTGFGKSKVAIDIIKHKNPKKVVILVNSTLLRDIDWEKEFIKWGMKEFYDNNVEMNTYQAAYKWRPETKDLTDVFVIADECDFAADTDELSKFFYAYPSTEVLGFTGFVTSSKREWFKEHLPIFTELTASDAQNMDILNKIHFVFVKYELSNNPNDITVNYMKGGQEKSFSQSENNAYDYAQKQVMSIIYESSKLNAEFMLGLITKTELDKQINSLDYKMKSVSSKRRELLLHSKTSQDMAKGVLNYIQVNHPTSKTIVFSKRVDQSIAICGKDNVYNGKIPKKQAHINYSEFLSGVKTFLGVCDKVNRGANIEGLDRGILETYFGSDTKATQRMGRLMRLKADEVATMYVLLPYYLRKGKDEKYTLEKTQQVVWATEMLRSTNIKSSEVWNYCTVKTSKK